MESKSQRSQKQFLIEDYIPPAKVTKEYFYQPSILVLTWFQMQKSSHDLTHTYCWDSQLAEPSFVAAPVSAFSHAPMADGWDNIIIGMKVNILDTRFVSIVYISLNASCPKVEVENSDADPIPGVFSTAFWVATVLRIQGYKVL